MFIKMAYNPDKGARSKEGDTLSKDVTAIPGIGEINGDKLRAEGCYTVGDVLNKYKELGSKDKFLEWLDSSGITNSEHKRDCYRFINDLAN